MRCRFCGSEGKSGQPFEQWVKGTFMDHDKLLDGDVICNDCLFWFDERSEDLAQQVGKEKPQRMRNYSHFIVKGAWIPLSKGNKAQMAALLLESPFPKLAVIAESGQKHLVFRASRNPEGATCGWVQFEEQQIFVHPRVLGDLLKIIEALYSQFSKKEIRLGDYKQYRVRKMGLERWWRLEQELRPQRGSLLFYLGLFLAQRRDNDANAHNGQRSIMDHLAGDSSGLQESLSNNDMATIRGPDQKRGVYQQPGHVRQLGLFES